MGNLKHYIKALSSGESYYTLKVKLTYICNFLAAFHLLLTVAFFLTEIYPMMIYCAFSVFFFAVYIRGCIRKEQYGFSVLVSIFEVLFCSFAATFCVGIEAGFSVYNFALIVACFYLSFVIEKFRSKESIPFFLSLFSALLYVIGYIIDNVNGPMYALPNEHWVHAFHVANYVVSFAVMIIFNFLFVWEIKSNQNILETQNDKLTEMAHIDPLTHLMNRRSMNTHLQQSMDALRSSGKRFSLVLCDIDDFKKVNDTYGHDAGDLVLVNVADIISQNMRSGDVVCRWGGEEILILIHAPLETATNAAERIRQMIAEKVTYYEGQAIQVTMTFGIAESIPGYKIEHLVQQADDKLYIGKKNGKNIVVF